MDNKKTIGIYFIIILVFVSIYLVFISVWFFSIMKVFDSIPSNLEVVSIEVAGLEVLPALEGDSSTLSPPFGKGLEEVEEVLEIKGQIMGISAYNLVESQCDSSPLIGAFGDNLMEVMDLGIQVCASNAFSKGTKLQIQGFGECVVMDRMNSRYKNL